MAKRTSTQKDGQKEMTTADQDGSASAWITYRPETKIVDCTIRDGGLMNSHKFTDDFVKVVYEANVAAGVDYMEFGYKADVDMFDKGEFGKWKFSSEEDLRGIVGENDTALKISVMADSGRTNYHRDILPCSESVVDLIRVACYIHQIPEAMEMIAYAKSQGYEVSANLMAVSIVPDWELEAGIKQLAKSDMDCLYLVDSFGSLHTDQVRHLSQMYLRACEPKGQSVGVHAHNNLQMAYSNTINSMIQGITMLDGSLGGLGRGAGNCPTEMLLGCLHNPKYKVRSALKCIQETILPMKKEITWGFDHAYMITGFMNQHPRSAIAHNDSKDSADLVKFYDQMTDNE